MLQGGKRRTRRSHYFVRSSTPSEDGEGFDFLGFHQHMVESESKRGR